MAKKITGALAARLVAVIDLHDCGQALRGAPAYEAVVVRAAEGKAS